MKMKRIGTILLALLMLISFTACNLDNNGILYRGPNRTPSDNKNRNYIGKTSDTVYFVSDDGLTMATYSNGSLSADQVISADNIFQHFYQSYGWLNGNDIIYVDDIRGLQNYYRVTITDGQFAKSTLQVTGNESTPVFLYRYYVEGIPYIVMVSERIDDEDNPKADTVAVYKESLNNENSTLQLEQIYSVTNYTGSENGLLWYETKEMNAETNKKETVTKFKYAIPSGGSREGKDITFWHEVTDEETNSTSGEEVSLSPQTIQSVLEYDYKLYVLTSSDSQITIYSGSLTTINPDDSTVHLDELTTVSAYYNSSFPTFFVPTAGSQKLIFLDYNISDSSVLYCVNLSKLESDPDNATTQTSLSSGIEAEAFIQFESQGNTDIVYMMTKNHGFYKIDVSSGTPSVSEA